MLWLWILLAALALLVTVLLVRTFTFKAPELSGIAPCDQPLVDVDNDRVVESLARAVTYKTISYTDHARIDYTQFDAFHKYLAERYPLVHARLEREVVNGYSLLYRWKGKDAGKPPVLFMAHQDVVPIDEATRDTWEHDPFAGDVADGYIWGRGAMDMKSHLIAVLEAAEALLAQDFTPQRDVYISLGHDEEIDGQDGAAEVKKVLEQRNIRFAFVLDEGGAIVEGKQVGVDGVLAVIGMSEKGMCNVQLTTQAGGGHASMPPRQTAVGVMARAIDQVQRHPMRAVLSPAVRQMFAFAGPRMGFARKMLMANLWLFAPLVAKVLSGSPTTNAMVRTTTAPTLAQGSPAPNVLPQVASANINCRIAPGDTVASVEAHIRQVIGDARVEVKATQGHNPSPVSDASEMGFKIVRRSVQDVFPDVDAIPYLMMAASDARQMCGLSDCVMRFSPYYAFGDALSRVHANNERVPADGMARMVQFFARVMQQV
nr:M20 family peptidase [Maliibacterium massiliense]